MKQDDLGNTWYVCGSLTLSTVMCHIILQRRDPLSCPLAIFYKPHNMKFGSAVIIIVCYQINNLYITYTFTLGLLFSPTKAIKLQWELGICL